MSTGMESNLSIPINFGHQSGKFLFSFQQKG